MQFVVCSPGGAKAQLQRHELDGTPPLVEVSSFFMMGVSSLTKDVLTKGETSKDTCCTWSGTGGYIVWVVWVRAQPPPPESGTYIALPGWLSLRLSNNLVTSSGFRIKTDRRLEALIPW